MHNLGRVALQTKKAEPKLLEMTLVGRAQLRSSSYQLQEAPGTAHKMNVSSGCTFLSLNTNSLEQDLLTCLQVDLFQSRSHGPFSVWEGGSGG